MLPDALDLKVEYPLDSGDYAEHVPSGPNMAEDGFVDGLVFFLTSAAVLLSFFMVGALLSLGAKRLGIRRPLSLLILLVSFTPAILHAQYMQSSVFRVTSGPPTAKTETLRTAVAAFTSASLLYALAVFVLGALLVWHVPWTVLLAPFSYSTVYVAFPLQPLLAALAGTDIIIDNLIYLHFVVSAVLLSSSVLGWVWSSKVAHTLRYGFRPGFTK